MAHLTLGELQAAQSQVIRDHRDAGIRRLVNLQARPGYGPAMLRQHAAVLPRDVAALEKARLRAQQDRHLTDNPIAFALTQLRRAYEDDDIPTIRRWEAAVVNAGGRRYLEAIKRKNASYRARGLSGLGGCRRPSSGLGGMG